MLTAQSECHAHHAIDEERESRTSLLLLMQEVAASQTRLDQRMQRIESLMGQLLEAMADEDSVDQISTYLDGSPV